MTRDLKSDLVDAQTERDEARALARIMWRVLFSLERDPAEYDDALTVKTLPDWLTGLTRPRRIRVGEKTQHVEPFDDHSEYY